ncbi:hypothetical protein BC832DRAFT_87124 [Gaertneriomyces semiglobifer]|nr:hypothetical protein BC832DRAFT_87124 [Gaertneriomyces semiglobifer]
MSLPSGGKRMNSLEITFPEAEAWTADEKTIRQLFQSVLSKYKHREHFPFQLGLCGLKVTDKHTIAYHPVRMYHNYTNKKYQTTWCPVSNNYARNHLLTDEKPPILFVGESETWSFTIAFAAARTSIDNIYSTRLHGDIPNPADWDSLKENVLAQSVGNIRNMKQRGTFLFQEAEVKRRLEALSKPEDMQAFFGTGVDATDIIVRKKHETKLCNIWFQCPWTEKAAPTTPSSSDQDEILNSKFQNLSTNDSNENSTNPPDNSIKAKVERNSTLCYQFFKSAASHQSKIENGHIFLGVHLKSDLYSTTYGIVGLRELAKKHGYQFIGIDRDSLDVMCNFGYEHRISSGSTELHREAVREGDFAVLIFRKSGSGKEIPDISLQVRS